jgi:hypothetical protein
MTQVPVQPSEGGFEGFSTGEGRENDGGDRDIFFI